MKRAALLVPLMLALHACEVAGQERIDQTIPSNATGQVEITNVSGSIRVTAWDRNEIRVTGTLGRGTERLAVEGGRDRTTIRVVIPRNARNVRETELEVRVPARKDVVVRGVSAEVEVEGVTGSVDAGSTSGSVAVSGSPRQVSATSISGEVDLDVTTRQVRANSTSGSVSVAGRVQESVTVSSTSGEVEVTASAPEVAGETVSGSLSLSGVSRRASASTVSGSVSVESSRVQYLSLESVSGEISFSGDLLPGAAVKAESHSGSIVLELPANVAVDFKLSTFSGGIENDFGPPRAAHEPQRAGARAELLHRPERPRRGQHVQRVDLAGAEIDGSRITMDSRRGMRTSWVALIALAASVPATSAAAQDCEFTTERAETLSASGLELLRIGARAGSLRIVGRAGLTEIRARGTACASTRALLDEVRLVSRRAGSEGELMVEVPRMDGMGNYSMALDLVIEVPESLALDVTDSSGDLEIRGVGALTLKDSSGEVEIADVRGSLDLEDSSGNVEVDGVRGDVRLRDSSGEVSVRNVTGSVLVENDSSGNIELADVGGDVEVANDSSGGIDVARVRGDFTVRRDSSGGIRSRDVAGNVQVPARRR